ncbi:MAG: hypothetical protein Q4A82_01010 [Corynebacterium sp.]|nr:hypothetical protein [Corynebacterium sp.]
MKLHDYIQPGDRPDLDALPPELQDQVLRFALRVVQLQEKNADQLYVVLLNLAVTWFTSDGVNGLDLYYPNWWGSHYVWGYRGDTGRLAQPNLPIRAYTLKASGGKQYPINPPEQSIAGYTLTPKAEALLAQEGDIQ